MVVLLELPRLVAPTSAIPQPQDISVRNVPSGDIDALGLVSGILDCFRRRIVNPLLSGT